MAAPKPWVMSERVCEGGLAGSIPCRRSIRVLQLHGACPGLSLVALPQRSSARFTSILSSATPRPCITVASIHATDPDFYNIPYLDGIPVGKRLKLWNLPPNCKHSELLEWFSGVDVVVESLEFTDDPALNAQGIGGFVEFATKQDACIAIVRLDGYKFRGHYIRMDFAEKRPRPRDYGSRRSRPNHNNGSSNNSSRGNSATPSRPSVTNMVSRYGGATSSKPQTIPRYEAPIASTAQASSGKGRIPTSADMGSQSSSSSGEDSNLPGSPHQSYGKWDPRDDPFKGYGAPEQVMVEPWSNKTSFRWGPMYGSPQPSSFNRLFVGNLAPSVNDATLQQLFSKFGTVLESRVLREPESRRSRGFGIIAMSSVEEVKAAFEALDGWHLDSRPLRVDAAVALKR